LSAKPVILIVDDDSGQRITFSNIFESKGYLPKAFETGNAAIVSARKETPAVALIDLKLEDMQGIEVLKEIKDGSPSTECIMVTGHASTMSAIEAVNLGAYGYVEKPCDMNQLLLMIQRAVETRKTSEALKKSRQQSLDLSAYLQSSREAERTSIAREIHDDLGQIFTALKMDLRWIQKRISRGQQMLGDKIQGMTKLVDIGVESVQRISSELRPGLLDDLGLSAAIEWQTREFANRAGIEPDITIDPEEIEIERELSTAVFRILQEALTNISRHSGARIVTVALIKRGRELTLTVKDDGRGITRKQASGPKAFGLIGMRERVRYFAGELDIQGIRGKGTTVTAKIPLAGSD
jgi:signal transduction histidine kinase